jgi:hypothetical protein
MARAEDNVNVNYSHYQGVAARQRVLGKEDPMKNKITIASLALMGFIVLRSSLSLKDISYRLSRHEDRRCASCHQSEESRPTTERSGCASIVFAVKTGANCADCHDQSCLDCHTGGGIETDLTRSLSPPREYMPKTQPSDWKSNQSLNSLHNPQNCYRCHDATFCFDCHSRLKSNTLNIKSHVKTFVGQDFIWNSEHSREARRNLQSCRSCHPEEKCVYGATAPNSL